jgi:hypothetical protein
VGNKDNPYVVLIGLTNDHYSTYKINENAKVIASRVFSNCSRVTSITVPDSVTSISDAAFSTYNTSPTVTLQSILFGKGVMYIGNGAFSSCTNLTSVTIPDSVTTIGNNAFYNCSSLTSVVIGESVTSIGDYAFSSCSSLTSIVIPDSVTFIGDYAFYNCSSLTSIVIPNSVTAIGNDVFTYSFNLADIYYTGNEQEWNSIKFGYSKDPLYATIHYNYVSEK